MIKKLFFLLFSGTLLFSEEKIYFLHIPKTGGVSVTALLRSHYTPEQKRGAFALLRSKHVYYHRVKNRYKGYKFITFLRHPIARVLSEHRFCLQTFAPHILKSHFLPPDGDPIETASNVACKILSGLDPEDRTISIEQHLESAKKTLAEDIFFLGITEKMDESMEILYKWMGWQLPEKIPFLNMTDHSKEFYSPEVVDGIAKRNWADIELYQYALKLFEDQKTDIFYQVAGI